MIDMSPAAFEDRTERVLLAARALRRAGLQPDSADVPLTVARVEECLRMLGTDPPPRRAFPAPRFDRYQRPAGHFA
jgi:hypothetical protein